MRKFSDIHSAYQSVMHELLYNPEIVCSPRGQEIHEITNYMFQVLQPTSEPIRTQDGERNQVIADYTQKEVALYNSCSNRVEDFAAASKFWNKLANPDGTINSAYGYLIWRNKSAGNLKYDPISIDMMTQWDWAKISLIKDKDSRQAFFRFSLPEHQWFGNCDQVCTMHGVWHIRSNKLNLTITMRSNDVVLGLVYDLPWFCSLIDRMLVDLKPRYPDLEKGTYTHIAHSMHLYTRDLDKVKLMLGIVEVTK